TDLEHRDHAGVVDLDCETSLSLQREPGLPVRVGDVPELTHDVAARTLGGLVADRVLHRPFDGPRSVELDVEAHAHGRVLAWTDDAEIPETLDGERVNVGLTV